MVVVVSVCRFPGGVFTACPESFHVDSKGDVHTFTFEQWKEAHLAEVRGSNLIYKNLSYM